VVGATAKYKFTVRDVLVPQVCPRMWDLPQQRALPGHL